MRIKQVFFKPFIARQIARLLAKIHQISYVYLGTFSSAAEGGLHPKHRLIDYHKFFVDHVSKGESVLEVGCGNGALLRDIALKTRSQVTGVEISVDNVLSARARLSDLPNVDIVHADIWAYEDERSFHTIVLSNVLEHLERRTELLSHLKKKFKPQKFLIRVPMFEREWVVPFKKELGVEWRLDPTHKIEYSEEDLEKELLQAGIEIVNKKVSWGEIYAVAVSSSRDCNL